jgi:hypothetical protein
MRGHFSEFKKKISDFFDAVEMLRKSALLRKKIAKKEN